VAIEQMLKIYELLAQRRPGKRHGIEHLALPTPDQLARLAAIGTMAATQTIFLPAWARPSGAPCLSSSTRGPTAYAA
jgi:predicted amidohydrolase YtcJ